MGSHVWPLCEGMFSVTRYSVCCRLTSQRYIAKLQDGNLATNSLQFINWIIISTQRCSLAARYMGMHVAKVPITNLSLPDDTHNSTALFTVFNHRYLTLSKPPSDKYIVQRCLIVQVFMS